MTSGIFRLASIAVAMAICTSAAHAADDAAHKHYKVRQGAKLAYAGTVTEKGTGPVTAHKAKPKLQAKEEVAVPQDGFHFTPRRR